ncbi:right-handed parallel beta-helix repeat-containing protein [Lysobacter auxotrophicus]|uniref:Right-handed parallel beta-helix repeat-containing protein n=1 Tax=Lysobacter auxotrophicus TaxID=2992573 RepID=A0ABN6UQB9_9GAMM|nr:right-handed parallel beta-helix repeat-containing protein [Lysobacter auxotrophicus]BDU17053.1 right-handed parallel beta-helix repeat-containing protein [Lysobacter auxotrophicus]
MPDLLRRRIAASLAMLSTAPMASWAASPIGSAVVDVRRHGARGNGVANDTRAFQQAIDALPAAGGTVQVPAGDYLIDPTVGVQLRSRMHLAMSPGTRLLAKPNAAERAYVLNAHRVSDVTISGGRIIGERSAHKGITGEWGHGLMIRAAERVNVRDLHISHCWGDGISIGGAKVGAAFVPSRDVTIERVVCADNRRQGLTIGRSRRVRVFDSEFIDTGGTAPGAGIDVEPDEGDIADDILIARCTVRGNRGAGIQLYKRVSDATVRECLIEHNRGHGILTLGASDCLIEDNRIRENVLGGVGVRPGTRGLVIARNEFDDNGPTGSSPQAKRSGGKRHVTIAERTERISVAADNRYLD